MNKLKDIVKIGDWAKGKTLSGEIIIGEVIELRYGSEWICNHIMLNDRAVKVDEILEIRRVKITY